MTKHKQQEKPENVGVSDLYQPNDSRERELGRAFERGIEEGLRIAGVVRPYTDTGAPNPRFDAREQQEWLAGREYEHFTKEQLGFGEQMIVTLLVPELQRRVEKIEKMLALD